MNLFRSIVVAAWLGAALFFSSVVAPSAFGVLRQFDLTNANEIAGTIVSRTLAAINISGFVIGFVFLMVALVWKKDRVGPVLLLQWLSLAVLTLATALGKWFVAARMLALRSAMGIPIDRVAAGDPRRQAFDGLHYYSVALLSAAMIAAIVSLVLFGVQRRAPRD